MENKPNSKEDVDLGEIFKSIGRIFNRIGDNMLYVMASLRNTIAHNLKTFILIVLLGLVSVTVYHFFLKRDYYEATMVLNCNYLSTQFIEASIENINQLAEEPGKESIASVLNIDQQTAESIDEFEFEPFVTEADRLQMELLKEQLSTVAIENKGIIQGLIEQLKYENSNTFSITAVVYDPKTLPTVETALLKWFTNNSFIKKRIEINRENLTKRKQKLLEESKKLDSLKVVLFQSFQAQTSSRRGSNNVIVGEEKLTNPLDVFSQDLSLHAQILDIDKELHISNDFEVVVGFTPSMKPANFSLFQLLIISFVLSFLFAYIFVGISKFNRVLNKYETRKS